MKKKVANKRKKEIAQRALEKVPVTPKKRLKTPMLTLAQTLNSKKPVTVRQEKHALAD